MWEATNNGAERGARSFRHLHSPHYDFRKPHSIEVAIRARAWLCREENTPTSGPAPARCGRGRKARLYRWVGDGEPLEDRARSWMLCRWPYGGGNLPRSDPSLRSGSAQYTSLSFGERLKEVGIKPSMGRTGTALDNAMAESFVSTLKAELVSNLLELPSRQAARTAIFE